jgi:recombination protein RecA
MAKEKKGGAGTKDSSAIDAAIREIKTKFGDEAIMKLGEQPKVDVDVIPSGSIGLDWALGIGGFPRGRIMRFLVRSHQAKQLSRSTLSQKHKRKAASALL